MEEEEVSGRGEGKGNCGRAALYEGRLYFQLGK